jgi:hypothetical protein
LEEWRRRRRRKKRNLLPIPFEVAVIFEGQKTLKAKSLKKRG